MEDFCQSKTPAVHRQNGGRQGGLGGNVQVSFLATSWETPRSSIKKAIRSARDTVAQYERMATHKAKNLAPPATNASHRTSGSPRRRPLRGSDKSFHLQTHLGRAIYAPKMEDFCQSKTPAVCRKTAGDKGVPRGNAWARFLATSCRAARSSIKCCTASALCEPVGEVVKSLAKLPLPSHWYIPFAFIYS